MNNAILLISCPDEKGITAQVSTFIYKNNGNIEHADQHIDNQTNTFFMRIEWALKNFSIKRENIAKEFSALAKKFDMRYSLTLRVLQFLLHATCTVCMIFCCAIRKGNCAAKYRL